MASEYDVLDCFHIADLVHVDLPSDPGHTKTTRSYMTRIPQLALFVWFVGTGHFGLLGFVQSQQSTFLTIGFPIFISIPVILAIVYMVIYRRYTNS